MSESRIVIIGGGFAGLYTALKLEKLLKGARDVEVALLSKENFFLFTPMLPEAGAWGAIESTNNANLHETAFVSQASHPVQRGLRV